jgi:hypothetical protein
MRKQLFIAILALFCASTAGAQAQVVRVRGTIEQVSGDLVTVKTREGDSVRIRLASDGKVVAMVKASLADIKVGSFVGATAMPAENGGWRAIEVHIFPEAMRGAGEGDRPFDYRPKSTMTNGTVNAVDRPASPTRMGGTVSKEDGTALTLQFKGGEKRVEVTPETVIYTYADGGKDDLKPGARVFINGATRQADGTLLAARINVGRGVEPPM